MWRPVHVPILATDCVTRTNLRRCANHIASNRMWHLLPEWFIITPIQSTGTQMIAAYFNVWTAQNLAMSGYLHRLQKVGIQNLSRLLSRYGFGRR
jgi:hypothetical protein